MPDSQTDKQPGRLPDSRNDAVQRILVTAQGQVQGVGFRPFIYRLARDLALTGHVGNTSEGVCIEVQGTPDALGRFPQLLRDGLPPLARLTGLAVTPLAIVPDEQEFTIVESSGHHGHNVLISPDVGICDDCLADMQDPGNRRFRYPFTNCTNCGPRYTITRSIPYDRAVTSMACFPLCPDCAAEYRDPLDRRFHAQPIACPVCGPHLWFVDKNALDCGKTGLPADGTGQDASLRALDACVRALLEGRIVALRGLGGFQLACDARNADSVQTLRLRKNRPHKSFALMVRDAACVADICHLDENANALLSSPARPAVVLPRRKDAQYPVAGDVAPDIDTLAVMLPTTPLHVVLFDLLDAACEKLALPRPVLVMTSGNDSGDPICLGNREALGRLGGIADAFLLHDRDILCRVDDSVLDLDTGADGTAQPVFFRRARGYVPSPLPLGALATEGRCALGAGADLKATCCLTRGADAFAGQHIGDLEHPATAAFYQEILDHLRTLLEVEPDIVVTDAHPDFFSARAAAELADSLHVPLVTLQHHAAHAAAVLAEHQVHEPALALILDGFGYGLDGTVWGGELLRMDLGTASWSRPGHLATFALPGGDAATRAPWRIALALGLELGDPALAGHVRALWQKARGREADIVAEMVQRGLNSPRTSSCGRLFDAVSAQLGLGPDISYEGQAAIRLETQAWRALPEGARSLDPARLVRVLEEQGLASPAAFPSDSAGTLLLDSRALFARVCRLQAQGLATTLLALDFHWQLARSLTAFVLRARERENLQTVALGGGVFNNALLRRTLHHLLAEAGCRVLLPSAMPPGDGGLSLGQAAWGLALLRGTSA